MEWKSNILRRNGFSSISCWLLPNQRKMCCGGREEAFDPENGLDWIALFAVSGKTEKAAHEMRFSGWYTCHITYWVVE